MKRKIFIVGNAINYMNWMQGELVNTIEQANLIVFTGGEDVYPELYGEKIHPTTSYNKKRDYFEKDYFELAQKLKIPCIGICRGNQFLTVMSGGKLVQHQENPYYIHKITTFDNEILEITSTHHQAAYPFNLPEEDYKILGWTNNISNYHKGGNDEELNPKVECEIMYYPKTNCLGIQGHPEHLELKHPTIDYLRRLLNKFLENKL
jgi:putative glutamine amidotransferase